MQVVGQIFLCKWKAILALYTEVLWLGEVTARHLHSPVNVYYNNNNNNNDYYYYYMHSVSCYLIVAEVCVSQKHQGIPVVGGALSCG